ncbi:hypothetical protein [Candidatus Similichlamydia laticola]|uniref:Uncharacterized protein n=1 Tax=Candidatus Similichlamydia laticola TaxID=2170265 RepID=A0A369KA74_9BACT|nr:hypothetical protein [Candidatus Similichlamydia laticola]RDB31499.1 hypothetical protein HAT2_00373 [Candidatus Similichlamydia laticola]
MHILQKKVILVCTTLFSLLGNSSFEQEHLPSFGHQHSLDNEEFSEVASVTQLFSLIVRSCMPNLDAGKRQVFLIGVWDPDQEKSFPLWLCFPRVQNSNSFCKGCALWGVFCQLKKTGFVQGDYPNSEICWVILRKDLFVQFIDFFSRGEVGGSVSIEAAKSCVLSLSTFEDNEDYWHVTWSLLCSGGTKDLSNALKRGSLFQEDTIESLFPFSEKSRQLRKPARD